MSTAVPRGNRRHRLFTRRPERTGRARNSPALPAGFLPLSISPFRRAPACQEEKKTLPGVQAVVADRGERVAAQHLGMLREF